MKKKAGAQVWLGVLVALAGMYFLCIKPGFTVSAGDIYAFLCAFAFAMQIIVVDEVVSKVDPIRLSCIQFFVTAILATVLMFIFEKPSFSAIIDAAIPILYAGVMSSGIAYTLQIVGQKYTDPTVASMLMSLESVFALLSGMIIQPEQNPFKLIKIMGCAAIFAAIIIAQLPDRKKGEKV